MTNLAAASQEATVSGPPTPADLESGSGVQDARIDALVHELRAMRARVAEVLGDTASGARHEEAA